MVFLNPLALLGLAAAAIPLLVHLFHLRRPRRVDFSSLRFLRELERHAMRRLRLRQWLLLALRTLALACLAVAFARPVVPSAWAALFGTRAETATALVLDASRSMSVRDRHGERLAQARARAAAVAEALRPGDALFVLASPGEPPAPTPFRSAGPALDAIAAVEARPGAFALGPALARAFDLLEGSDALRREVVVVTDLQAATFPADSLRVPAPEGVRLVLLPVGEGAPANTAVVGARVASAAPEVGRPLRVEATLVHHGPAPVRGVGVSLFLEGERVAQASADLRPGLPETVGFTATPRRRGWLAAEVRLEGDAFPFDDAFPLVVHVPATHRVLLVEGAGQRADLVALALAVGDDRFAVATVPEAALAAQPLEEADVVVLVGPQSLPAGVRAALARFVREGGGLLTFPSTENADLSALLAELGGGGYGPLRGAPGQAAPVATLDRPALDHPLFEVMFDREDGEPERPELRALAPLVPAGRPVWRLTTGEPVLQEVRAGAGSVFAFGMAPDPRWGDLPLRGLFVPLLHRAIHLLAAGEAGGDGAGVRVPGAREGIRLVGPDGQGFAPPQRAVPGGVVLDLEGASLEPGVYDVRGEDGTVLRRVAVAPDPRESDLAPLPPAEAVRRLEAITGAEVLAIAAGGPVAAAGLPEEGGGVELWRLFLVLALACLVAEQLVAMRWRAERAPV